MYPWRDLSRSLILYNINFWPISSLFAEIQNVKVLKRALCFIMWYVFAMETYITLFLSIHFCKVHSIGPINVCTNFEINRYKIDEFGKHAKIVCFIWRHVTQKRYVVRYFWSVFSSGTFATYQKSLRLPVQKLWLKQWFNVFDDLDLEFWPMLYWLSHKVDMKYWNLHSKIHKNLSRINGWYGRG